nr:MAG TPA: hypothetical protein [Caudoviricetes sp.]
MRGTVGECNVKGIIFLFLYRKMVSQFRFALVSPFVCW